MRGQLFARTCAAFLFLALAGCSGGGVTLGGNSSSSSSGGSSSGGSSSGGTAQTPAHISLISSSASISGGASTVVTLTATVTDSNNVAITGTPVSFKADSGVVVVTGGTANTVKTATDGTAIATLSNGGVSTPRTITVTATDGALNATATIQVTPSPVLALGTLSGTVFTAGAIQVGQSSLSAGGSTGLEVVIYDTANNVPYNGSGSVTFTSPCSAHNLATIVSPVASATATYDSTYTATGCSGADVVTATATVNGSTLAVATGTVTVQAATLGSILFDSATTMANSRACSAATGTCVIGIKGTGQNETAQIYFKVLDSNGNPVQGQAVNFSLSTIVGGLSVSPGTANSDANGEVVTIVQAGTVHTSVRVTATVPGTNLSTQSSLLTVSTGFPTQNGISLAATKLSLQGDKWDGNTSILTARLSDRYQNPVPDGTAVSFTTECGNVQPSCSTVGGACQVTFTTQNPRTGTLAGTTTRVYADNNCAASPGGRNQDLGCDDHRCTVTAYAIGEESFNDCNGNGVYTSKTNPANNSTQCPNGDFFVSMPEVWVDTNESGIFNGDFETFIDFNKNGKWDAASGKFVGLLCSDPNCDPNQSSLNVSQNLVIVMTSNTVQVVAYQELADFFSFAPIVPTAYVTPDQPNFTYINTSNVAVTYPGAAINNAVIHQGCTSKIDLVLGDSQWQVPPVGTAVGAAFAGGGSGGTIVTGGSATVLNTSDFGYYPTPVKIKAPTGLVDSKGNATTGSDELVVTITTPPATGGGDVVTSTGSVSISYPPPTTPATCP